MSQNTNADASFFKDVTPKPGPMTIEESGKQSTPQNVDASFYDHNPQTHSVSKPKESHKEESKSKASHEQKQSEHKPTKGAHDGFPVEKPASRDPTDLKNDLHKHQITDLTHAAMVKESLKEEGNHQAASHVENGLLERKQVKATELKNDLHQHSITDLTHAQMVKESLNEEGEYKKAKTIDEGLKEKNKVKDTELKNDLHQHKITDLTHAQMVKEELNEEGEYRSAKQINTKNLKEGKEAPKVDARFEDSHATIEGVTKVPGGMVDTRLQKLEQKLGSGSGVSPRHHNENGEPKQDKKREGSELKKENADKKPKVDARYETELTDTIPRVVDSRLQQLEEKLAGGHHDKPSSEKPKEEKHDAGVKDQLLKEASKDKSLHASKDPSYETSQRENEQAEKKKAKEADQRYEEHRKEANDKDAPITDRMYAGAQMLGDSIEGVGHRVAGVYYQQGATPESGEKSHDAGNIEKQAKQALDAKYDNKEKRSEINPSQPVDPAEAVGNRDKQEYNQKIFTSELGWDKPVDKVKPIERRKSADTSAEVKKAELHDPDQPLSARSRDGEQNETKNWEMEEKLKAQEADQRYEQHKNQLADPDQSFITRLSAGVQMVGDTLDGASHKLQETVAHFAGQQK